MLKSSLSFDFKASVPKPVSPDVCVYCHVLGLTAETTSLIPVILVRKSWMRGQIHWWEERPTVAHNLYGMKIGSKPTVLCSPLCQSGTQLQLPQLIEKGISAVFVFVFF